MQKNEFFLLFVSLIEYFFVNLPEITKITEYEDYLQSFL